jgi:hypothetical protein
MGPTTLTRTGFGGAERPGSSARTRPPPRTRTIALCRAPDGRIRHAMQKPRGLEPWPDATPTSGTVATGGGATVPAEAQLGGRSSQGNRQQQERRAAAAAQNEQRFRRRRRGCFFDGAASISRLRFRSLVAALGQIQQRGTPERATHAVARFDVVQGDRWFPQSRTSGHVVRRDEPHRGFCFQSATRASGSLRLSPLPATSRTGSDAIGRVHHARIWALCGARNAVSGMSK